MVGVFVGGIVALGNSVEVYAAVSVGAGVAVGAAVQAASKMNVIEIAMKARFIVLFSCGHN